MTKRKRTNDNLQNNTQKTKGTKGIIRSRKSKDRQYNDQKQMDKQ